MSVKIKNPKENNTEEKDVEKYWPQILAILIGSLSGFGEGLNVSWTSPFLEKITEDKENYDITQEQASYFNTIYPLGMLIGCPVFSILSDKIGRKRTFLVTAILQISSWILSAIARDVYLFYIARFCAGLSCGCFFSVFPFYIGEIANPIVRGSWGNAVASSLYSGQMMINIIGSYLGIKETSYVVLPIPLLFLILFSMMPESPYFYIMKGKEEQAKKSLKFLTRKKNIDKDYLKLKSDVQRQLSESTTWVSLFKIKSNRKALIAGTFLRFSQQTSGLGVFAVYTQTIFQNSDGIISHQLSSIIYTALTVIFNLFVIVFIVHRFNRKTLYIGSLLASAISLYLLGTYFILNGTFKVDLSSFNWIPITSMVGYMFCTSFGVCVIPTLMMSELFSASIKAKAMIFLLVLMSAGNIIINTSFYYIAEYFGFHTPFYLFAICNSVSAVLSFYVIPETRGKTLEEIQQMLKRAKKDKQ